MWLQQRPPVFLFFSFHTRRSSRRLLPLSSELDRSWPAIKPGDDWLHIQAVFIRQQADDTMRTFVVSSLWFVLNCLLFGYHSNFLYISCLDFSFGRLCRVCSTSRWQGSRRSCGGRSKDHDHPCTHHQADQQGERRWLLHVRLRGWRWLFPYRKERTQRSRQR